MAHEAAFDDTVDSIQRAGSTFLSGDPEPAKNFWSKADDVTIFGGWGAYELGWAQVGPRLEWAATRFACGFRSNWITDSGRIGSVIPGFWITPLKEVVARSA